jgi:aminoglycoside 6-adenylyltransferase
MSILDKLLDLANINNGIRIVVMNGSRVNPNIESDKYQDYDIVFYVNNYQEFIKDFSFIDSLGEVLVKQTSLDQRNGLETISDSFTYMTQYKDGSRLDLTIRDVKYVIEDFKNDSLSMVLIDKDDLDLINNPNESSYYVKKITKEDFRLCVNEFYWVCPYVAKGLARNQLFYAMKHMNIIRHELENMIDWFIGSKFDFKLSVGKGKSRYQELLSKEMFEAYKSTFPKLEINEIIRALKVSINFFDQLASALSVMYNFKYSTNQKQEMLFFLGKIYKI